MDSIWLQPQLSNEIMNNEAIFKKTESLISDIVNGRLDVTQLVENLGGVLTHTDPVNREKGMRFFTKVLKDLPFGYLTSEQVKFISQFYTDRLKDHHSIIPAVLEGYLSIIDMKNYNGSDIKEFLTVLFREVPCQSQVRQDRHNIYTIVKKNLDTNIECIKQLGPDFVYGFISAMDGERDPRNLIYLFTFLPQLLSQVPLGHLVDEMFEVISCYYPIDFHPAADDPAAVQRQDLADALAPCLCATPVFAQQCLVLLVEKLDSSLRLAKIDSLMLLIATTSTFPPSAYEPFLKTLWSSIRREITHKLDHELKMAAHRSLSALIKNLSSAANTDQSFENVLKGIIIAMQTEIAGSTTVAQFVDATKILLTTANASKESCAVIVKAMIPAIMGYYEFNTSDKLQIASLEFLGDLYDIARHGEVLTDVGSDCSQIPQLCLSAVSDQSKEKQIAGFKCLIRVKDALQNDLVVPFVEVLVHNINHSLDKELVVVCIDTVIAIAQIYPKDIKALVVNGKCNINNLFDDDNGLEKRLKLLCDLVCIEDFAKDILDKMITHINAGVKDTGKIIKALNESFSNENLFTDDQVMMLEQTHNLIDVVIEYTFKEIDNVVDSENLSEGYKLISRVVSTLGAECQKAALEKHSSNIVAKCKSNEKYIAVLEALYNSLHQNVYTEEFKHILSISLSIYLNSNNSYVKEKSSILIAHLINKVDADKFELLYGLLKDGLEIGLENGTGSKLMTLYGWIAKALVLRGNNEFIDWLKKIALALSSETDGAQAAAAIKLIVTHQPGCLTHQQHSRAAVLYRQRVFHTFAALTDGLDRSESYLLSWAYVLAEVPKSVLNSEVVKVAPLVIDSLVYDNKDLLLVSLDVLTHLVQNKHSVLADSLQTILPRLVKLSMYAKSMDVRMKSLRALYDIGNIYPTALLLPYKQDLLHDIAPSLDDKKRLVRSEAVKARTRWFVVGAPGETKDN